MKLIITRHGETEENKASIIQGHLPWKLSAEWVNQAEKVALRLKYEKIDFIFSSDLARAADTAKEIAKFHPNTPIRLVEDLRERNMWKFQGKNFSDFNWNKSDFTIATFAKSTEVEPLEQLYNRAERILHKLISEHNQNNILLVWHNGINKVLIAIITGKNIEGIENQYNTSINMFEIDKNKICKTHVFDGTKHLN